jgi:hypothetical protein
MKRVLISTCLLALGAWGRSLPLAFEPNQGQADSRVQFLSTGNGVASYLMGRETLLRHGSATVRMRLVGARSPRAEGLDLLPGTSSYFIGSDASRWHTRIPQFARVRYRNIYAGVDLIYYGNQGKLEYDFVVAPGADPSVIRVAYSGLRKLSVDSKGDLVLETPSGEIRQRRPVVYQESAGHRVEIAAAYRLDRAGRIGIEVGRYDATRPLIIDPVIEYGTYFGGGRDDGIAKVKVGADGNVYLLGQTLGGSLGLTTMDITVTKFSNQVLYTMKITSSPRIVNGPTGLAVDAAGNAYIAGITPDRNFPMVNAFQSQNRGIGAGSIFVAKVSPDGSQLLYSTYLGGSITDLAGGIAVDSTGNLYLAGSSNSPDFPVRNSLERPVSGETGAPAGFIGAVPQPKALVAKLSPSGSLIFASLFGGDPGPSGFSQAINIAVDSSGVYAVGTTTSPVFPARKVMATPELSSPGKPFGTAVAFAVKLSTDGQSVIYSTLLGFVNWANGAAVDSGGNLYIGGGTTYPNFPVVNAMQNKPGGANDAFIAKLNPQGDSLLYSTYLGGDGNDGLADLAVNSAGEAYLVGGTYSKNFPLVNALPARSAAEDYFHSYVAKLSADGKSLVYSTLLGANASATGIDIDSKGKAWVGGSMFAGIVPTTRDAYQAAPGGSVDAFLVELGDDAPAPATSIATSPGILQFNASVNGPALAAQTLSVTATDSPVSFTVLATTQPGGNWLSLSTASGSTPGTLTVSANPSGLAPALYSGSIVVTPTGGAAARTIPVTLLVGAADSRDHLCLARDDPGRHAGSGPPHHQRDRVRQRRVGYTQTLERRSPAHVGGQGGLEHTTGPASGRILYHACADQRRSHQSWISPFQHGNHHGYKVKNARRRKSGTEDFRRAPSSARGLASPGETRPRA